MPKIRKEPWCKPQMESFTERQHMEENEFNVPFRKAPRIIVGHSLVRARVDELITDSGECFRAVLPVSPE